MNCFESEGNARSLATPRSTTLLQFNCAAVIGAQPHPLAKLKIYCRTCHDLMSILLYRGLEFRVLPAHSLHEVCEMLIHIFRVLEVSSKNKTLLEELAGNIGSVGHEQWVSGIDTFVRSTWVVILRKRSTSGACQLFIGSDGFAATVRGNRGTELTLYA